MKEKEKALDNIKETATTDSCTDTPGWEDSSSYTCTEYALNNWCPNGKPKSRFSGYGAEENCCACIIATAGF